ncbi:hypothetical protein NIES19_41090 [Anabaena cylindrica PCC 7122]|nr:hypothetical protein NIES19_41090 [Anabaena cylindrica PCC 7122]
MPAAFAERLEESEAIATRIINAAVKEDAIAVTGVVQVCSINSRIVVK